MGQSGIFPHHVGNQSQIVLKPILNITHECYPGEHQSFAKSSWRQVSGEKRSNIESWDVDYGSKICAL